MVSVVIPLYNKETTIVRAVQSVLDGSVQPFEIIVVDDGSTDGSVTALKAAQSPLLRIIRRENGGAAAARNTGVREATGDMIAFLDADDYWFPDSLKTMLSLADDFPGAGLYGTAYAIDRGAGPVPCTVPGVPLYPWRGFLGSLFDIFRSGIPFCSDTVLIPKAVFLETGGFMEGEAIGEDVQMWLKIGLKHPVAFDTAAGAVYCQNAPNRAYTESKPLHAAGYARWLEDITHTVPAGLRPSILALREHVELGRLGSLVSSGQGKQARAVRRAFPFHVYRGAARKWAALSLLPRPLFNALRRIFGRQHG